LPSGLLLPAQCISADTITPHLSTKFHSIWMQMLMDRTTWNLQKVFLAC